MDVIEVREEWLGRRRGERGGGDGAKSGLPPRETGEGERRLWLLVLMLRREPCGGETRLAGCGMKLGEDMDPAILLLVL